MLCFGEDSLVVGFSYTELSLGLRISYGIFFDARAKIPSAISVGPTQADGTEEPGAFKGQVGAPVICTVRNVLLSQWMYRVKPRLRRRLK